MASKQDCGTDWVISKRDGQEVVYEMVPKLK